MNEELLEKAIMASHKLDEAIVDICLEIDTGKNLELAADFREAIQVLADEALVCPGRTRKRLLRQTWKDFERLSRLTKRSLHQSRARRKGRVSAEAPQRHAPAPPSLVDGRP